MKGVNHIEFVIAKTNKLSFVRSRGNWRKSISPGGQAFSGADFVGADVRIRDSYDIQFFTEIFGRRFRLESRFDFCNALQRKWLLVRLPCLMAIGTLT